MNVHYFIKDMDANHSFVPKLDIVMEDLIDYVMVTANGMYLEYHRVVQKHLD